MFDRRYRRRALVVVCTAALAVSMGRATPASKAPSCRVGVIEGELKAGEGFSEAIGGGLKLWFQPIASGWILRVVPGAEPAGEHDYAELATPPYRSVTPLSLSTDFAFRAQDAVGWNPRRFKYASSAADFRRLDGAYGRLMQAGATPAAAVQEELANEIAKAANGKLTIVDAKLVPGVADQWRMAAAVSSRFNETAHTLVLPEDGKQTPLGKLIWVRFRVELELPKTFKSDERLRTVPHNCGDL